MNKINMRKLGLTLPLAKKYCVSKTLTKILWYVKKNTGSILDFLE